MIPNALLAHDLVDPIDSYALAAIRARKRRERFFSPSMFGEPAWDLLLTLCAAGQWRDKVQVSRLSESAGTPATTALRWLAYLEREGLVDRHGSLDDHRVQLVEMTERAHRSLGAYFSGVTIGVHD